MPTSLILISFANKVVLELTFIPKQETSLKPLGEYQPKALDNR
jgi:hypothetical protein